MRKEDKVMQCTCRKILLHCTIAWN